MPLVRKGPPGVPAASQAAATPSTLPSLAAADPDERWAAARRLADDPGNAQALAGALTHEGDLRVREAILTALVRIGTAEAAALVLPCLRSDDAALRTGAIDALRAMPRHLSRHLPALLADRDPDVRLLSCELVRELPEAEANRLLAGLLDGEAEKNVCAAAVEVLVEIGRPEILPSLQRCARRFAGDDFLQFGIKVATERIGAPAPGKS